jgi:uncharacterized protein YjiS (DUF1127 family)
MSNRYTATGMRQYPSVAATARPVNRLVIAWRWLQNRRRIRRTERALMELSDHTLKDIGIHRSEAGAVARR